MRKLLLLELMVLLCLSPAGQREAAGAKAEAFSSSPAAVSALSPSLMLEKGAVRKVFQTENQGLARQMRDLKVSANLASSPEDIFSVLNQWYAAKDRRLVIYPRLEEKIRQNKTLLYYFTSGTGKAKKIVAISFLCRLDEKEIRFYFDIMGMEKPASPVWHRAISETDADVKGYRLGTSLLQLTIAALGETNYLHGLVEYQGDHPQGQQRWEDFYRSRGFQKVEIMENGFSFMVREPNALKEKKIPADIRVSWQSIAVSNKPLPAAQSIAQAI